MVTELFLEKFKKAVPQIQKLASNFDNPVFAVRGKFVDFPKN